MSNKYQVSIIMATYNADMSEIYKSLSVACKQIDVDYEIIVTDDGSNDFDKDKLVEIFNQLGFDNYKIICNDENQGTVKNFIGACKEAKGEFVFFTAPGDIIFDYKVMLDCYSFAKERNSKVVFGNYIEYSNLNNELVIHNRPNRPIITEIYNKSFEDYKRTFCFGTFITGSVIFREREYALKSLEYISKTSKYVEDNTTLAYALADNQEIHYFDRKMVWYELGEGISTSKENKWNEKIYRDLEKTFGALVSVHPKDKILKTGYKSYFRKYGALTKPIVVITHPIMVARLVKNKKLPKQKTVCNGEEQNFLNNILNS